MAKLLTVKEVCLVLGISRGTAITWIRDGRLKAFKLGDGRLWRVREIEIKRFIRTAQAEWAKLAG